MALYTDEEFLDTSGYTPSPSDITELKEKLRSGHARSLPSAIWAETEDSLTHTHNEGRSDEHPTLQLSLDDLRERVCRAVGRMSRGELLRLAIPLEYLVDDETSR